ncbi:MGC82982 protein [Xenopus laevis]|uniref:exodeoxyribonuclease III n=1 Tax=Xenopus laevis TaxID=8355 RepID=Q6GN73_XENLA|nr:uncharacterized protein LOC444411 [Xenopus laevis]AAH73645.1 MGC82982 protein [Xenopus laevis]
MTQSQSQALNIYTINANVLNSPWKRKALLQEIKAKKIHIALIQETHYKTDHIPKWYDKHFSNIIHSTPQPTKVRGTAILIANSLEFELDRIKNDTHGNYSFVKGKIHSEKQTFASIYLPNAEQNKVMEQICTQLLAFAEGTLILGGDLNTPLDPKIDCSSGTASITYKKIKQIKLQLQLLQVMDSWRIHHPTGRDYTHFSHSHNTHNRIDYIFLSHDTLDNLRDATIEATTWSDHSLVILRLHTPLTRPKQFTWKLNDSLRKDPKVLKIISTATEDYFQTNADTASSAIPEWEAYKCVIRGILIQQGARLKRDRQKLKQNLISKIQQLDQQHKLTRATHTLSDLTKARQELKLLIQKESDRATFLLKKLYYDHGNKCGKMLARALKTRERRSHIFKMKDSKGNVHVSPAGIQSTLTVHSDAFTSNKQLAMIHRQKTATLNI